MTSTDDVVNQFFSFARTVIDRVPDAGLRTSLNEALTKVQQAEVQDEKGPPEKSTGQPAEGGDDLPGWPPTQPQHRALRVEAALADMLAEDGHNFWSDERQALEKALSLARIRARD